MREIITALSRIAELEPASLSPLALDRLPDFATAAPLAHVLANEAPGGLRLIEAAAGVSADRELIDTIAATARDLIEGTRGDLVSLALDLGQEALPLVPGLLSPVPGVRAATLTQLEQLAQSFLGAALARSDGLMTSLDPLADDLDRIATTSHAGDFTAASFEESTEVPNDVSGGSGEAAVAAAMSALGTPYVWGGTSTAGFDCSGLTQWAWRQAGVELPRLAEHQTVGRQVSADQLQPGDLAVWDGHVAMYAGNGQMVEAGDPVQTNPVRTTNIGMPFKGFWRPTG